MLSIPVICPTLLLTKFQMVSASEEISRRLIHPAEGSLFEVKGVLDYAVDKNKLVIPEEEEVMLGDEIEAFIRPREIHVVAATVGEDEHSVGMREIIDIKHGGLEKYAVESLTMQ